MSIKNPPGRPFQGKVKTSFPPPRFRTCNPKNAKYFFDYWHSIPEAKHDMIEVRVYRCWPIIRMEIVEPERRDHQWELIEGACPFDPETFEYQILGRSNYGCGDYRFDLKEKGGDEIVIRGWVSTMRDYEVHPPILDYRTLVNDPKNEDYVRYLRKRNVKLPWEDPQQEDDMAGSGEMFKVVVDAVKDLSQSAIQANKEATEAKVEAMQAQLDNQEDDLDEDEIEAAADARAEASKAGFGLVTHAATAAIDMMARHAGAQFNPIELMKAAKEMMGGGAELGMLVNAVRDQGDKMITMQKEQFDFMRTIMTDKPAPANQLETLLQSAQQLKSLRELMGWGPEERDPAPVAQVTPKAPEKPIGQVISENLPSIIGGLTTICALAANIIHNMKASGPGQLRNPAEDMLRAQQANPAMQMMGGMQQQPGVAQPQPAAQPTDLLSQAREYVSKVSDAIRHHFFDDGCDGYSFAQFVLSNRTGAADTPEGRRAYGTIKETVGREKFDQLIRESDVWPQLQGMPQKYKQFLDEFFSYDEWNMKQQAQEAAA